MKKNLIFAMGLVSITTFAQTAKELEGRVGINTQTPRATLDIVGKPFTGDDADKKIARGAIFPHISDAEKANFTDLTEGLVIWNTTKKCIDYWDGTKWQCYNATANNTTPKTDNFTPSEKCLELVYDRNYGDGDHNFIYCAVKGPDGRIWLNHNLGAEYAKEGSEYFNPQAEPIDYKDSNAFGSLFQLGRKADGHELVTYGKSDSNNRWTINRKHIPIQSIPKNIFTGESYVNNPSETDEIKNIKKKAYVNANKWWYTDQKYDDSILEFTWIGKNNPCPVGYNVAFLEDMKTLLASSNITRKGTLNTPAVLAVGNVNIVTAPTIMREHNFINLTSTAYEGEDKTATSGLWLNIEKYDKSKGGLISFKANDNDNWRQSQPVMNTDIVLIANLLDNGYYGGDISYSPASLALVKEAIVFYNYANSKSEYTAQTGYNTAAIRCVKATENEWWSDPRMDWDEYLNSLYP